MMTKAKCSKHFLCEYLDESQMQCFQTLLFCLLSILSSSFPPLLLSGLCVVLLSLCLQFAELSLLLSSLPFFPTPDQTSVHAVELLIEPFAPRPPSRLCPCQNPAAFHWMLGARCNGSWLACCHHTLGLPCGADSCMWHSAPQWLK